MFEEADWGQILRIFYVHVVNRVRNFFFFLESFLNSLYLYLWVYFIMFGHLKVLFVQHFGQLSLFCATEINDLKCQVQAGSVPSSELLTV